MGYRLEIGRVTDFVPKNIAAGVNFTATAWLPEYSGAEWAMVILLRGPASIDLSADRDAARHVWDIPAADTAAWAPGVYAYQLRASNGVGDAAVVESGRLVIEQDFASLPAGADTRSENRRALEAIEAVLAKRATLDQSRYRINNRELYRESIGELMRLRNHFLRLVAKEEGRGPRFGVQVKFRAGG